MDVPLALDVPLATNILCCQGSLFLEETSSYVFFAN
jgi:hypothetical protein